MKNRFFFRGAALASALVLLTPLAAASANDSSFRGSESADVLIDPEYDYSVVDVEPAAHVRDRAQNLLGERYVDLWITPDQTSYVVGVHDVLPKEVARLESAIAEVAPVMVVNRPISRWRLDQLGKVVAEFAADGVGVVNSYAIDYEAGAVVLTASRSDVESIEKELTFKLTDKNSNAIAARIELDSGLNPVASDGGAIPRVLIIPTEVREEESANANPYRAGKYLRVGSAANNCTTGFTVVKNGLRYGLTAGHCGKNGSKVYFAGTQRGNISNNTLWAANPAKADASLFRMVSNSTAYLYRSSTTNRKISGSYASGDLVKNLRVCTRGAFTANQSCGPITSVNVNTYSNTASRYVQNGYGWRWDPSGTKSGDSGAPVYRVMTNGSVKAVGIHRAGNSGAATSYFTSIRVVLSQTGSSLVVTN